MRRVSEVVYAWFVWLYTTAKFGDIATFLDNFHVQQLQKWKFIRIALKEWTNMAYVFV